MSKQSKQDFIDKVAKEAIQYASNYDDLANLTKDMVGPLIEKFLQAELDGHLGYEKHDPTGYNSGNSRNGTYKK
jgi:transposase-like protein